MASLSPLIKSLNSFKWVSVAPTTTVSYISLHGPINAQMTQLASQLLSKVPRNTSMLALVLSSQGGDLAQAHLIGQMFRNKASTNNIEFVTFGEQIAINSAFYLLQQGNRVYADRTTVLGGHQQGEAKLLTGSLSQYVKTVVYEQSATYLGEQRKDSPYETAKKQELEQLYNQFSQQTTKSILQNRKQTIENPQNIKLDRFFSGEEAHQLGLIDGVGRIHGLIPKMTNNNVNLRVIYKSRIEKIIQAVNRFREREQ